MGDQRELSAGRVGPDRVAGAEGDRGRGDRTRRKITAAVTGAAARVGAGIARTAPAAGPDRGPASRGRDLHPPGRHRRPRTATRNWQRRISKATGIIHCSRPAITRASLWPGCFAPAQPAANTAADHLRLLDERSRRCRRRCDAADDHLRRGRRQPRPGQGAGPARLPARVPGHLLRRLEARRPQQAAIGKVPETAWQAAIDGKGQVRERRADEACGNPRCAHRACWIEEAHVAELTGLLREGPAGDQLKGWPKTMRVFARRERPHPGAQLSLFEAADAGATPCGPPTFPPRPGAGAASAPTSTPRTGSTPASRT